MPEATMICLDSSDYMRNGDYFPSRISGAQEACTLMINSKTQTNPENTIGFLTMGGKACTVRETLTTDVDRVMASAATVNVGGTLHFAHGLQIAQLALSHRINRRHEARIVAFVGSPVMDTEKELEKLAKKLRKDDIAVDVIAFGVNENEKILDTFVAAVNKNNNSHLVIVPVGSSIVNAALSGLTEGGAPQDFSEYGGVDPSVDPELAMVLRMSLEEERRRISEAANTEQMMATGGTASPSGAGVVQHHPSVAPPAAASPSDRRELTEEEELELALKLSMQDGAGDGQDQPRTAPGAAGPASGATDPAFHEALQDPEFMRQLREDAEKEQDKEDDVNDASKKQP